MCLGVLAEALEVGGSTDGEKLRVALRSPRFDKGWSAAMTGAVKFDETGPNTLAQPVMVQPRFTGSDVSTIQLTHRRSELRTVGRDVGRNQKRGARPRVCLDVGGVDVNRTGVPGRSKKFRHDL